MSGTLGPIFRASSEFMRSLPFTFDVFRAGIVFEHQSTAIDRLAVPAPSPVPIDLPKLATAAALLDVEMVPLIVGVHHPPASVAPEDGQEGTIERSFGSHAEIALRPEIPSRRLGTDTPTGWTRKSDFRFRRPTTKRIHLPMIPDAPAVRRVTTL